MIEKTGYCWSCGRQCSEEFCNDKCKKKYEAKQGRGIKRGKRAGYGAAGSTH